jgi:hypothetical protein
MNWERLSSIAEIFSSVAILVTLVYLAIEINQNSDILQANSRDNVLGADLQHLYRLVDDPRLWLTYSKPELTETEKIELFHLLAALMRIRERDWLQVQSGALDEETWQAYKAGMLGTLSFVQTRKWWEGVTSRDTALFAQGFIDEVQSDLESWAIGGPEGTLGVFD